MIKHSLLIWSLRYLMQVYQSNAQDTVLDLALPDRSKSDFGLRPNNLYVDKVATVVKSQDCRVASGIIGAGLFCGPSDGFDGKYTSQVCAGEQCSPDIKYPDDIVV